MAKRKNLDISALIGSEASPLAASSLPPVCWRRLNEDPILTQGGLLNLESATVDKCTHKLSQNGSSSFGVAADAKPTLRALSLALMRVFAASVLCLKRNDSLPVSTM